MKSTLFLCLLMISSVALSHEAEDCKELKSEQIRLALIASNLANAETTRTPEGGPYRIYIIKSCSEGGCDVERDRRAPLLKYLPDHPDANTEGYVAYPNIDIKNEYALFNMTVSKLRILGHSKACGTKIKDLGNSFLLRYGPSTVKEDIFNLDSNHQAVSWARTDSKGEMSAVNFLANGRAQAIPHSGRALTK